MQFVWFTAGVVIKLNLFVLQREEYFLEATFGLEQRIALDVFIHFSNDTFLSAA